MKKAMLLLVCLGITMLCFFGCKKINPGTAAVTNTVVITATGTPAITLTGTAISLNTATTTYTITASATTTGTDNITPTITVTYTVTSTVTETFTITETATITQTPTLTPCGFGTDGSLNICGYSSGFAQGTKYTNPSDAVITGFSVYANTSGNAIIAIYTNSSSNMPDTLVTQTDSTVLTGNEWNTITLSTSVSLSAGTYWLFYQPGVSNMICLGTVKNYTRVEVSMSYGAFKTSFSDNGTIYSGGYAGDVPVRAIYTCP